ncbi:MAG: T9SS type A sorting domain-containing protein [Chitinophagales bacterium]|nr:T9SS type A sorting domain-containing protein [Chitinophagales bacterium]
MQKSTTQPWSARTSRWLWLLLPVGFLILSFRSYAQQSNYNKEISGTFWSGDNGITMGVNQIISKQQYMEENNLLQKQKDRRQETNEKEIVHQKYDNPESPRVASYRNPDYQDQTKVTPGSFTIGTSFNAVNHSNISQGWIPPDPMMACGPTQLVVTVNGRIRVFDKAGTMQYDFDADVFFASVRGSSNAVDPRVRYDAIKGRWIISSITIASTNNRILIAVSSGSAITGTSSFTLFQFAQNTVAPAGDAGLFADYETLGVDANALYIGCNMFNSNEHSTVFVIKKNKLYKGVLKVFAFRNIGSASTGGIYTPQGVSNDDPAATEGYFVGIDYNQNGLLVAHRVIISGSTATLSPGMNLTVPSTAFPNDVPNKNGSSMDAIDARLLLATIHKDVNTGASSLWCSHSILVNSSGVGIGSGNRDAVRWYQIGNLTTSPVLLQSGTLFDAAATAPKYYWMGTISMNNNGDAIISCSSSSSTTFEQGTVAAHFSSDGAGSTSAPQFTTTATTGYSGGRWGDYSSSCIDPSDNTTFWCAHEYVNNGDYSVRVVKVTVGNAPQAKSSAALNLWSASLFPNPANSQVQIQLSGVSDQSLQIVLTDVTGKTIMTKVYPAGTSGWSEDVSQLAKGMYLINITSQDALHKQVLRFEKN